MERDNRIMLAVFERFLENPKTYFPSGSIGDALAKYHPPGLKDDPNTVRWHILVLLSEFLLPPQLVNGCGFAAPNLQGTDYLNWSGQCLYGQLKKEAQH